MWSHTRTSRLDLSNEELRDHEKNKHRLGNLALMVRPWNVSEANNSYQRKREQYRASKIRMLNRIANQHDEWGVEQIDSREEWMVDTIIDHWPDNAQPVSLDEFV